MSKNRSVSEVKAKLSEYIRDAQRGDPVVITRHGQAIAAIVGADELQTLQRLRSAGPRRWARKRRGGVGGFRRPSTHPGILLPRG